MIESHVIMFLESLLENFYLYVCEAIAQGLYRVTILAKAQTCTLHIKTMSRGITAVIE